MSLIQELAGAMQPNLTDTQKGMLTAVSTSATPQQAYEVANGTDITTAAKNELVRMGMLAQNGNQLTLTQQGNDALQSNNLIDATGQMTEEGQKQFDALQTNKQEYVNLESFELFKSFYRL